MEKDNLKRVREVLGLQQGEMAELVDVAQSYYSNIENKNSTKKPSKKVKEYLKRLFAIDTEYIETGNGKMFLSKGYNSSDEVVQTIHEMNMDIMFFLPEGGIEY